jgi:signal transduction histidine kinase
MEAGEVERRHLAADLHDGVVQSLVGTSLSLSASSDEAARAGLPAVANRLNEASDDLRQGVRDLRSLIVAIAPPRLHDEGLAVALRDLVSPLRARGIDAGLQVEEELTLPPDTETLLYRGAQEALRNVTRHARAHNVDVSVARSNGSVRLEVSDDGVGFSPRTSMERRSAGHVGLHLLGELATDAGGSFDVVSAPGEGTRVRLEVPAR